MWRRRGARERGSRGTGAIVPVAADRRAGPTRRSRSPRRMKGRHPWLEIPRRTQVRPGRRTGSAPSRGSAPGLMVATRKSAARVNGTFTGCGTGLTFMPHSEDSTVTVYGADSAGTSELHNPVRERSRLRPEKASKPARKVTLRLSSEKACRNFILRQALQYRGDRRWAFPNDHGSLRLFWMAIAANREFHGRCVQRCA